MEYSAKELLDQFEASKTMYAALTAKLESDRSDMSIVHCLEPTDNHIKDLVRELRLVGKDRELEALASSNENLPHIDSLSKVRTFFHLLGYYATKNLRKIEDEINALKSEMAGLSIRGEADVSSEEYLAVLEDAVLLGYWKASYDRTNA